MAAMIIIVAYDGNHDVIAHMLKIYFQLFWCLFLQGISIDKSYKRLPHLIMTLSSLSCFASFEFVSKVEIWEGYSMVRHNMAQHILIKMHNIIKWIYIKLFANEKRAEKNDKSSSVIWFWPKILSSIHIIISHERFRVKNYISTTNDKKRKRTSTHLLICGMEDLYSYDFLTFRSHRSRCDGDKAFRDEFDLKFCIENHVYVTLI